MPITHLTPPLVEQAPEVRAALEALPQNELTSRLLQLVAALESGDRVSVRPAKDKLLSPQEAADYAGLSRPFLCKLLDRGVIAEQPRVGTHRKIRFDDMEDFMANRDRASSQFALDVARSEEARAQLVRDIAGVTANEASKFGF